ncbi:class I SAM-dependent methyltransferase [Clostridium sp. D2Q-14]|uniref:class I SAM-dependent methyltransferase n=1 Tax=Anaeromonas gelatinilytica TaxID=2683194 RepID=UPI00193BD622|nr:class I SAM-dependent methyltransferase [Anaeromonas gelatinilytica]MBS4534898.1 class I SAM-dependent methyltransferase [Anaeromonas gelatinilytica]
MELEPKLYHYFVRPKWFSKFFYNRLFNNSIDFINKKILDFGCGIGSISCIFQPEMYIGFDCDDKRIEYAKKLYPNYKFMTIKENKFPISKNSIDYIIISSVLHHIPTNTLINYLEEFKRILNSNGSLIIAEPCFYEKNSLSNKFMSTFDKGKYIRNEKDYLNIFKDADYNTKVIERYNQLFFYNKIIFLASPINDK